MKKQHDEGQPQIVKEKQIIFRLPEEKKNDFRIALIRNRVTLQNLLTAFTETFVCLDNGEKINDIKSYLVKRARALSGEA